MPDLLSSRWKGLLTVFLVAGLGVAIHTAPMTPQSPCEPGFFGKVQATVIPSAKAQSDCPDDYCSSVVGCTQYFNACTQCYDGEWTSCYEDETAPPPQM
ncbi:MAG: hypothetical protein ABEK84_00825 [Salinibacter sp.]